MQTGANPHAENEQGAAAMTHALKNGSPSAVAMLLGAGGESLKKWKKGADLLAEKGNVTRLKQGMAMFQPGVQGLRVARRLRGLLCCAWLVGDGKGVGRQGAGNAVEVHGDVAASAVRRSTGNAGGR